jgi:hypothetical protein
MVVTGRARAAVVHQQRAVNLYRQLSGKDPRVPEAEVRRIADQLRAIDQRVKPDRDQSGRRGAADRAELEAALGALQAYHLGGRQTDDALLGEIQAAWGGTRPAGRSSRSVCCCRSSVTGMLCGRSSFARNG